MSKGQIPPWQKRDCAECGAEFLATRSQPRPALPPPICGDCEMYQRGYKDAEEFWQVKAKILHDEGFVECARILDPKLAKAEARIGELEAENERLRKKSYTCNGYPHCTCRRQVSCVMGSAHPENYDMSEDM